MLASFFGGMIVMVVLRELLDCYRPSRPPPPPPALPG